MRILTGLPGGWELHSDFCTAFGVIPVFISKKKERRDPFFVASLSEGREVFKRVKWWLDQADQRMQYGASSQESWRAMDKAKFAMEDRLREMGRWDDSLLDSPLDPLLEDSKIG